MRFLFQKFGKKLSRTTNWEPEMAVMRRMASPVTETASATVCASLLVDMEMATTRVTGPLSAAYLPAASTRINTLLCHHSATKIRNRPTGRPPVLTNPMNLPFVNIGGAMRTFSSSSSTKDEFLEGSRRLAVEAEKRACKAELEAQRAVCDTEWESWRAERMAFDCFQQIYKEYGLLWAYIAGCWIIVFCSSSSHDGRSSNDGQSYPRTCSCGNKSAYQ